MIFRDDNNIIESLVSIYTSKYIRETEYKGQIKLSQRNVFLKNMIQNDKRSYLTTHVPEIDYETTIVIDGFKYVFDHIQENDKKLILYNVIEFDGKDYIVGEKRRFY
ncbi:MAG: hypothetical protein NZZ41_07490 [Candidatus Dojkabacteria bacterium]|nr:hypothetical protein [Candidatus Dojkabacteria bacterium]